MIEILNSDPDWKNYVKESAQTEQVLKYLFEPNDHNPSGGIIGPFYLGTKIIETPLME
jgi:hypothetical protein